MRPTSLPVSTTVLSALARTSMPTRRRLMASDDATTGGRRRWFKILGPTTNEAENNGESLNTPEETVVETPIAVASEDELVLEEQRDDEAEIVLPADEPEGVSA